MFEKYALVVVDNTLYMVPCRKNNNGGLNFSYALPDGASDLIDWYFDVTRGHFCSLTDADGTTFGLDKVTSAFQMADFLNKNYSYQITSVHLHGEQFFKPGFTCTDSMGERKNPSV